MTRTVLGVLAVLSVLTALAAPGRAAAGGRGDGGGPGPLENAHVRLDFDSAGTSLTLTSVTNLALDLPNGRAMPMSPGSGAWTLTLVLDGGFVGVSSAFNQWIELHMDGTVNWNKKVWPAGSPPASLALSLDAIDEDVGSLSTPNLVASWSGTVTLSGSATPYPFTVRTEWTLVPDQPFAETRLAVDLDPDDEGVDLPFYLSYAVYPTVHVTSLTSPGTPDDTLVLPHLSGVLVRNPTSDETVDGQLLHPFPSSLNFGSNLFTFRVAGYYDDAPESNCFVFTTNDCDDHVKELWVGTGPPLPINKCENIGAAANGATVREGPDGGAPRYVTMRFEHVREDVYSSAAWELPYQVRLGAIEGDWWDLAQAYRDMLVERGVPWYTAPVGSPANPMPEAAKRLVAEVLFQPNHFGDTMDYLRRQVLEVARVLGPDVCTLWYHGHAPDRFSYWYYGDGTPGNTGYLPGRPSLASAVRSAQKAFGHVVAPYVQSSGATDCTHPVVAASGCIDDLPDVYASFLQREDHSFFLHHNGQQVPTPPQTFMCSGASWWQAELPARAAEIATFTGAEGVYLDFFLTDACYSSLHHHALPGEPPGAAGGGNWPSTTRMRQVRDLQDALPADLVVLMEFALGRFAEEVHVMHLNPAANLLAAELYSQIDCTAPPFPRPMDNAVVIPFFHAVFDNVKISSIKGVGFPKWPDRRAWTEASLTFTFGMIPGIMRAFIEEVPTFSQRSRYSPFFTFLGDLVSVLRDDGFLTWHNGTLRRLPGFTVPATAFTDDPGPAIPGIEVEPYLHCVGEGGPYERTWPSSSPLYTEIRTGCNAFAPESFLTPGMFQAPEDAPGDVSTGGGTFADAGSLAFVLANPWVDLENPGGTLTVSEIVFEPSRYPGWDDATVYSVHRYRRGQPSALVSDARTGAWAFAPQEGALAPGDIVWWVFRRQSGAD